MALKDLAAHSGAPWVPKSQYFRIAEPAMAGLWEKLVWPFIKDCDFTTTLDLAAGHGRNSAMLLPLCQKLYITDYQAGNVEICAKRFAAELKVSTFVGDGFSFAPMKDKSLTFIYCFDAMVHFDSDVVRSYLKDARRVLRHGGMGFFHHSNSTLGEDWQKNPAGRNFMTAELFAHYARKEGLTVLRQQVIDWAKLPGLDCLTMVRHDVGAPVVK